LFLILITIQGDKQTIMIKKDIFNGKIKERLKVSANDRLYRFMLSDKMIRGAIVNCTLMINEMRANHNLGNIETLVLGQAYIASSLLIATLKEKDRISMNIQCSGPIKGLDVESNIFGEVRGFLKNPDFSNEISQKKINLSSFFGAGFLKITKYLENAKTPYSSQIILEYGDIAQDLANYFLQSEQTPTAFILSVYFDGNQEVKGGGGIFLQAMPKADKNIVLNAEKILEQIKSLGKTFALGVNPKEFVMEKFKTCKPVFMKNQRVEFFCRCSKARMYSHLKNLPLKDIQDILKKDIFPLEIKCHNCNSLYTFIKPDIENLLV